MILILFVVRWECSLTIPNKLPSILKKFPPLIQANSFPLPETAEKAFEYQKAEIENARVNYSDEAVPFAVEANDSYHRIAAPLNQSGRPVAFFPKTLSNNERKHSSVEKEIQAIVEALLKWMLLHSTYWSKISSIHVWFKTGREE